MKETECYPAEAGCGAVAEYEEAPVVTGCPTLLALIELKRAFGFSSFNFRTLARREPSGDGRLR